MTYAKLLCLASVSALALGGCAVDTDMFGQGSEGSDAELSYDQQFEPEPYRDPAEPSATEPSQDDPSDPAYEQWETSGQAGCESVGFYGTELLRVDEPVQGKYALPGAGVTLITDGYQLAYESSVPVRAVLVAGGGHANVYAYADEVFAHQGLLAPDSVPYGVPTPLDHVVFCGD